MRILLLISVLFLSPVLTHAQSKTFYKIALDFYKGPDRHAWLLAVTDSGLTYRVRKRPSIVASYAEISHLRVTKETKSFGITHIAAIAAVGNLALGLGSRNSLDHNLDIVQGSNLIYFAGSLLETLVHPSPLVINFRRYKPDPTALKHMLEPFISTQ